MGGFNEWYAENKDSEILREDYKECKKELKYSTGYAPTFKQWVKEVYDSLNN